MTTTAEALAQNAMLSLRDDLTSEVAIHREAAIRAEADDVRAYVLYADCGMVMGLNGNVGRLFGTRGALVSAHKFPTLAKAQAAADHWNSNLTHEQSAARCAVTPYQLADALGRAIEEIEALLEKLAALPAA